MQTVKLKWPGHFIGTILLVPLASGTMSVFSYFRSGPMIGRFCPLPLQVTCFFFCHEKLGGIVESYTCCISYYVAVFSFLVQADAAVGRVAESFY